MLTGLRSPALVLALALGGAACADDSSASMDTGASPTTTTSTASTSTGHEDGVADTSSGTNATTTTAGSESGEPVATVDVSGDAFDFGPGGGRVSGAMVSILEMPERTTTTDADGHFAFEALPAGAMATFVFDHEGFPRTYTKTFTLPAEGGAIERITFQVPNDGLYALLAQMVQIEPDPSTCQIASTVTRVGKSLYDEGAHGEAGATIEIDPPLPAEHGPVYFNASVFPDLELTETSEDGGILYVNVPPGTYRITAQKEGVELEAVDVTCDPDVLVNPSPPHGLQAL